MPDPIQASAYDVYDAQLVRMADYAQRWLDAEGCGADTRSLVLSGIDLFLGEVNTAVSVSTDEQEKIRLYQQRTHALLGVYTSPFLQAIADNILNPGHAQPYVYGANSFVYGANGFVYGAGARIVGIVTAPPVDDTEDDGDSTTPGSTLTGGGTSWPFTNQTSVTIIHNLGRHAQVQVFDSDGNEVDAAITEATLSQVTISFSQPLSGIILIS